MTIGQRIAQLRRHRGLTQRELANKVGRSESWVSQIERGILPLDRLSVLEALAETLGVSETQLRRRPWTPEPEPLLESTSIREEPDQ